MPDMHRRNTTQQATKLCACKHKIKKIVVFENSVVYFPKGGLKSSLCTTRNNVTDHLNVLSSGASCEQRELPTKLQSCVLLDGVHPVEVDKGEHSLQLVKHCNI